MGFDVNPRDDQEFERREYERAECDGSFQHEWDSAPGWGVFIGLTRCKKCNVLARASDFARGERG